MNVLILGAGDAARLYPFTLTQPKPLVPVAGHPILTYVVRSLAAIPGLDTVYLVTNHRFVSHFQKWAEPARHQHPGLRFVIVDDGSTDPGNQLGAVGDLQWVIRQQALDEDLIVVAGDNVFSEALTGFGDFCREHDQVALGVYDAGSLQLARNFGVVET
ncbi:MAG: sugar phosphate nucleotidyltransferase, partial [Verrucomicrobiota bacterium]